MLNPRSGDTHPADAEILEAAPGASRANDKEDTADREVSGATGGEKPPKGASPWTAPARNKAGRQLRNEASRG